MEDWDKWPTLRFMFGLKRGSFQETIAAVIVPPTAGERPERRAVRGQWIVPWLDEIDKVASPSKLDVLELLKAFEVAFKVAEDSSEPGMRKAVGCLIAYVLRDRESALRARDIIGALHGLRIEHLRCFVALVDPDPHVSYAVRRMPQKSIPEDLRYDLIAAGLLDSCDAPYGRGWCLKKAMEGIEPRWDV